MKHFLFYFTFFCVINFYGQEEAITLKTASGNIEGTLLRPESRIKMPLVLIIAGSGPTDRDGNQREMENNSLKFLAEEWAKNGIASVRYDKRGLAASSDAGGDISAMKFETMVKDAASWINLLSKDERFTKIYVAGHSEGSLVGMAAINLSKKASGFISIAGAGRPADQLIKEQLDKMPQNVKDIVFPMIDKIKKGDTISNVPPLLYSLFHPSLQAYLISWFKYDPAKEIKKLKVPVLIVQGTTDVQVKELDAQLLHKAKPKSELRIIKNMNHVLKDCDNPDKKFQMEEIYTNPKLPLNSELVAETVKFLSQPASPK